MTSGVMRKWKARPGGSKRSSGISSHRALARTLASTLSSSDKEPRAIELTGRRARSAIEWARGRRDEDKARVPFCSLSVSREGESPAWLQLLLALMTVVSGLGSLSSDQSRRSTTARRASNRTRKARRGRARARAGKASVGPRKNGPKGVDSLLLLDAGENVVLRHGCESSGVRKGGGTGGGSERVVVVEERQRGKRAWAAGAPGAAASRAFPQIPGVAAQLSTIGSR